MPGNFLGAVEPKALYVGAKAVTGVFVGAEPVWPTEPGGYDADAQALFNAWANDPGETRKALYNDMILALKEAGLWGAADAVWLLACHDAADALINLKSPGSFSLTAVNSPDFDVDEGYTGAASKYLNPGFNLASDGAQYALNGASISAYTRTSSTAGVVHAIFGAEQGSATALLVPKWTDSFLYPTLNDGFGAGGTSLGGGNTRGFWSLVRPDSGTLKVYHNGTLIDTETVSSTAIPAVELYLLANNANGSPSAFFAGKQISFCMIGRALNATEAADLCTIVETHMDAIGKGVI